MSVSNDMCMKVLHALNEHWRQYCYAPSLRELMAATDCNSTSVMNAALDQLAESGEILASKTKGRARSAVPLWVMEAIRGCMTTRELITGGWGAFPRDYRWERLEETFNTEQEAEIEGWSKVYYG